MDGINLIQDLAILLLAAGIGGTICRRLGLSVIVGYLIAGILIGPHTPPFSLIVDEARIVALSQVGLVFLMFSIGLGLSLTKFGRMGAGMLIATAFAAFLVLNLTELLGLAVGWSPLQAMFVAAMLMVSSSAVIAKIVSELNLSHERSSQTALAMTVLEDVVAVAMLTILASQAGTAEEQGGLGRLLGGLGAFVVLLVSAGLLLVPRLLRRLEAKADPEMQTVIIAGVLLLMALIASKAGYSIALGAFLFGAIVAEIPQKIGVEKSFAGLRDMFSSVFFVSIGMMIDVKLLADVWPMVLGLTAFALVARPIACGLALILIGTEPREAHRAGMLLTPLGEFSFIIAQLGISTSVLSPAFYPIAVGASILTVLVTPVMNRHREAILGVVFKLEPRWLNRTLDAYHGWVVQLRSRPTRRPLWKLLRGRLVQVAVEILVVSGLLTFSGQLLEAVERSALVEGIDRSTLSYVFWSAVTVLVLIPLFAIWRNCGAVAMILAEGLETGRLPQAFVERGIRAVFALALGYWLYLVVPQDAFSRWGWILIALGAIAVVTVFSRRLIYWHSEWQTSVREVLADTRGDVGEVRAHARAALGESLNGWDLSLGDCTVPDGAEYVGQTLAELSIPARFGCSVVEIDRNGHAITAPGAGIALFPGDRLLLLGQLAQVEAARGFLASADSAASGVDALEPAVLDTCTVPAARAGRSLADLRIATRTGVRVVGIHRGEQRILNPTGDQVVEAGDALLLIGTLPRVRALRKWLSGDDTVDSSPAARTRTRPATLGA